MDSNKWEDTLRKRYCEKPYYMLPYDDEEEEADCYEWEYVPDTQLSLLTCVI